MNLIAIDQRITDWFYVADHMGAGGVRAVYLVASAFVYVLPLILLYMFLVKKNYIRSAKIFVGIMLSWQVINKFLSMYFYQVLHFRDRPFVGHGIKEYFFEQPQKAFPSDHATALMAATTLFFYYRYPKVGWIFLVGMILTSISRVMMGFHFVGDILAGYLVGLIGFFVIKALDKYLDIFFGWLFGLVGIRDESQRIV